MELQPYLSPVRAHLAVILGDYIQLSTNEKKAESQGLVREIPTFHTISLKKKPGSKIWTNIVKKYPTNYYNLPKNLNSFLHFVEQLFNASATQ